MADAGGWLCPRCQTPNPLPALTQVVKFPDDAGLVIETALNRLNVAFCIVCQQGIRFESPVGVVNVSRERIALVAPPTTRQGGVDGWEEQLRRTGFEQQYCADGAELANVVRAWLLEYLQLAASSLMSETPVAAGKDGVLLHQTPLALLALQNYLDGRLPLEVRANKPLTDGEIRDLISRLHSATILDLGRQSYPIALSRGGPGKLREVLEARLPGACLSADVRKRFVDECQDLKNGFTRASFFQAFQKEYLNATVHAIAGADNPRAIPWAHLNYLVFIATREGNAPAMKQFVLDRQVLRDTIPFTSLWDATMAREGMRPAGDATDELKTLIKDVGQLAKSLGYWEPFNETIAQGLQYRFPGREELPDDQILESFIKTIESSAEQETSGVVVAAVSQAVYQFLINDRLEAATRLATHFLERARRDGDLTRLGWIAAGCCKTFNDALCHEEALGVLTPYSELFEEDQTAIERELRVSLFNEYGNCARHLGDDRMALDAYKRAERLMDEDPESFVADRRVLAQNTAIVLRNLGEYDESIRMALQLLNDLGEEPSQQRAQVMTSLANTYLAVNLPERALPFAVAAIKLTPAPARAGATIAATLARLKIDPEQELCELEDAFRKISPRVPNARRLAACALRAALQSPQGAEWARRAIAFMDTAAPADDLAQTAPYFLAALVEWQLHNGETKAAQESADRLFEAAGSPERWPWELCHFAAKLLPKSDVQERWQALRLGLLKLEMKVGKVRTMDVAASWLSDKEGFQQDLVDAAVAAVGMGAASAVETVDVFEFLNGREIRPRGRSLGRRAAAKNLGEIAIALGDHPARVVYFLETKTTIVAATVAPADPKGARVLAEWEAGPIRRAAKDFFDRVRFVLPNLADEVEASIADLLQRLGEMLRDASAPGDHLCLLPSASLLGLPLHAATLAGGGLLLERNTISVAPNFTTLAAVLSGGPAARADVASAIIAVPKAADDAAFKARVGSAADAIRRRLSRPAWDLRGTQATLARCAEALAGADAAYLVCHGVDAGPLAGVGVCISDGEHLPPALLPVQAAPDLKRFILDLNATDADVKTPALVASVACSSGRARPGLGGTRVGLERVLFSRGTRTIIAPTWDVEQESALAFLETLLEEAGGTADSALAGAFQRTCLRLRARYPALFQWAPFTLNGNWL